MDVCFLIRCTSITQHVVSILWAYKGKNNLCWSREFWNANCNSWYPNSVLVLPFWIGKKKRLWIKSHDAYKLSIPVEERGNQRTLSARSKRRLCSTTSSYLRVLGISSMLHLNIFHNHSCAWWQQKWWHQRTLYCNNNWHSYFNKSIEVNRCEDEPKDLLIIVRIH